MKLHWDAGLKYLVSASGFKGTSSTMQPTELELKFH